MNYMYNTDRYALKNCQLRVESMFLNDIHKNTGFYIFPLHKHDDFLEVSLILEGTEIVELAEDTYTAQAGDIIIKNANVLHQEKADESSDLVELSIGIYGVKVAGLPDSTLIPDNVVPIVHTDGEMEVLKALFFEMQKLYKASVTTYAETIQLALKTFVSIVLLVADKNGVVRESGAKPEVSEKIEEVLKYIDENFCNQISLDDVAKEFYISPYYLARQFKAETGYSVNQYIQQRRLGKAEQRLAFENTSIKEIAMDCGYTNLKYFYSVFKTKTGHTPNEFRSLIQP